VPVLVVDVVNVMGSRPDGWWRDRPGAATRLMTSLVRLVGAEVGVPNPGPGPGPGLGPDLDLGSGSGGSSVLVDRIIAVIEGQARTAIDPPDIEVVRAPADGDTTIVEVAAEVAAGGDVPLVVTADRGLRERLPAGSQIAGPGWLLGLL
jgi:hypothetical protein